MGIQNFTVTDWADWREVDIWVGKDDWLWIEDPNIGFQLTNFGDCSIFYVTADAPYDHGDGVANAVELAPYRRAYDHAIISVPAGFFLGVKSTMRKSLCTLQRVI